MTEIDEFTLLPDLYTKSKFSRFLLDVKEGADQPEPPRFKQFSDNLRNFGVAALMFKGARALTLSTQHPFLSVGCIVLFMAALVTTVLSAIQQVGLFVIASHWFTGWDVKHHMLLSAGSRAKLLEQHDYWKPARRPGAKLAAAATITFLFLMAMAAFILSPFLAPHSSID